VETDLTGQAAAWEQRRGAADKAFAEAQARLEGAREQATAGSMSAEAWQQRQTEFAGIEQRYRGFVAQYDAFYEAHPELAEEVRRMRSAAAIGAPMPDATGQPARSRRVSTDEAPDDEPVRERQKLVYEPDRPIQPVERGPLPSAEFDDEPTSLKRKLIAGVVIALIVLAVLVAAFIAFKPSSKPAAPKPKPKVVQPKKAGLDADTIRAVAEAGQLKITVATDEQAAQTAGFLFSPDNTTSVSVKDPVHARLTGVAVTEVTMGTFDSQAAAVKFTTALAARVGNAADARLQAFEESLSFRNGRCPTLVARDNARLVVMTTRPPKGAAECSKTRQSADTQLQLQHDAVVELLDDQLR
jgi:hypothetical protein